MHSLALLPQETESDSGLIQSVQRAVRLLKAFDGADGDLGVTELSRRVGLHKSTVSRLLATLEREGLVERSPTSDGYRLGFLLVRLAGQAPHFGDLRSAAHPIMLELSNHSHETVHLAVLDGDEVINIEQIAGSHFVRERNWVGQRTPLHCVANGKALLACQPPSMLERLLSQPLQRFTDRTITDPARLRADLQLLHERGYAQALGEIEEGLHAVAAPIRDASGQVVGAVSVSGPAYRVTPDRLAELGSMVVRGARAISERMGYGGE